MGCANKGTQIPVHLQAFPSACFQPLQLVEHLSTSKAWAAEFGAERWLGMLLLICCRTTGSMRASTNWKQNSSKRRKSQAELGCVGKGNGTTGQGCSQHPGGSSRYPAEGLPEPTPAAGLPGSQLRELHFHTHSPQKAQLGVSANNKQPKTKDNMFQCTETQTALPALNARRSRVGVLGVCSSSCTV